MTGTAFLESEALLAVLAGDLTAARAIITGLLPGERSTLAEAASGLAELCDPKRCDACSGAITQTRFHGVCSPWRVRSTP